MLYICNSFSLGMLPERLLASSSPETLIGIQPVSAERAMAYIAEAEAYGHVVFSAVDNADTARIFSAILARAIPVNRVSVVLSVSDWFLIGQYIGPRLPDGATELPPGARIAWLVVSVGEAQ